MYVFTTSSHVIVIQQTFLVYKKFGVTSFASVRLSTAQQFFWLADSEAVKLVSSDRHTFQKNVVEYEIINIYGRNLLSTEGSDWKRHRSIAMSAFNEVSCLSLAHFPIICLILVLQGKRCTRLVRNFTCGRRMVCTT